MSFAILNAVKNSDPETLEFLLKNKTFDINAAAKDGVAPIIWASYHKSTECMELLIKAGANIEKQDKLGYTALMITSLRGNLDNLNLLIKAKANIEHKSLNSKQTPLIIAAQRGNYRCLQALIDAGANTEAVDDNEWTALFYAVQSENDNNCMHALIKANANIEAQDYAGRTPIFFTEIACDPKKMQYLVDAGANIDTLDNNKNTVLDIANKYFNTYARTETVDIINILETAKEKKIIEHNKAEKLKQEFERVTTKERQAKQHKNIRRFINLSNRL